MEFIKKNNTLVHFIVATIIMFGFRLIPPFGDITPYGMAVLGIFLGMIYGWSADAENLNWASLLGMVALATTEYGGAGKVLAGAFNNESLILMLVAMFFLGMLQGSKVTEILANGLLTAKFAKGKPWVQTFLICIAPALLTILVNNMVVSLIMMAVWESVFAQAGYKKGDMYPAMVIMGYMIVMCIINSLFPFKGWCLMTVGMAMNVGVQVNMGGWMLVMALTIIIASIGWMLLMFVMPGCKPDKLANMDVSQFAQQQEKMTNYQKAVLAATIVYVVGAIIMSFAGGNSGIRALIKTVGVYGWITFMIALVMVVKVDGKRLLNVKEAAAGYYWDLIFVVASAMLIANQITAASSGISTTLTKVMAPIFALPDFAMLFLLGAITFIATNLANNVAVTITMLTLTMTMATQGTFGLSTALLLVTVFGVIGLLTPAGSVFGAMIHSSSITSTKSAYTAGVIMLIFLLILMGAVMIPLATMLL